MFHLNKMIYFISTSNARRQLKESQRKLNTYFDININMLELCFLYFANIYNLVHNVATLRLKRQVHKKRK